MNINLVKIKIHDNTTSYKYCSYDFCCEELKEVLESEYEEDRYITFTNENVIDNTDREYEYPSICIGVLTTDEFGESDSYNNYPIKYCPFCGEKIKITTIKKEDWTKEYEDFKKHLADLDKKRKEEKNIISYDEYNKISKEIFEGNKILNTFYYTNNYEEFYNNMTNIRSMKGKE